MKYFCSTPYIYTLEVTAACNAHCQGCGNVFARQDTCITPQQCQVILENIRPYVEMVRVTGGEPTLSPCFGPVLQLIDSLGKPLVVFTNGYWHQPQAVVDVLRGCHHLDGILVSLHGYSPESYRAFTAGDHFDLVVGNIRRANRAGVVVNTNLILTRQNIDHLPEALDVALRAGAAVVAFSRYYGKPILGVTDLTPDHYRRALDQIAGFHAAGKPVKFNNHIPLCLSGEPTQICPAGDTHCTISPEGRVRVCNHSPYEVGNALTTPISQIWNSEKLQRWRTDIPEPCQHCRAYDFCGGGCWAHAQANHLSVDPLVGEPFLAPLARQPVRHVLYAGSRPRANFALRQEPFGYVLINRSQIFKTTPQAQPLLAALLAGEQTLAQIEANFGQPALDFIGLLYDRRLILL